MAFAVMPVIPNIISEEFIKDDTNFVGEIYLIQADLPVNGLTKGIVQIKDADMNANSRIIEQFSVDVWSNSDMAGTSILVTEISMNSEIFEGFFWLNNNQGGLGHVRVHDGDILTIRYIDTTLPENFQTDNLEIKSTKLLTTSESDLDIQYIQIDDLKYDAFAVRTNYVQYNIPYIITHGMIEEIIPYCESASVVIQITPEGNDDERGDLRIILPRNLIDTKIDDDKDDEFFVLLNGEEIEFEEIKQSHYREIITQFVSDSRELEIIGAFISESTHRSVACNVIHNPPLSYILPPLKQMNNGVDPSEVICKENLLKVYKHSADYHSARCIDPLSADKLQERSWYFDIKTGIEPNK